MKRMILAVLLLVFGHPALAATILINPGSSTTTIAGTVDITVRVEDADDLYAYQFDLSFDPTVLSATSVGEGAFLPSGGSTFFLPGTIDNVAGTVTLTAGSLQGAVPGVTGSGVLALLQFTGSDLGQVPLPSPMSCCWTQSVQT
jgi:general secretion pathway protein D